MRQQACDVFVRVLILNALSVMAGSMVTARPNEVRAGSVVPKPSI